jgi:hypothetical protein
MERRKIAALSRMNEQARMKRRLDLFDDLLDSLIRVGCQFWACDGPEAPIRHMKTCYRCACIHRAIRIGLVRRVQEGYVRDTPDGNRCLVSRGVLEQFSVVDGKLI